MPITSNPDWGDYYRAMKRAEERPVPKTYGNTEGGGDFKVVRQYGDPIPTRKRDERIVVQSVEFTKPGGTPTKWIEARLQYRDKNDQWRPSKTAIGIRTKQDLAQLIDTLESALDDDALAQSEPAAHPEPAVPVEKIAVKHRKRAFDDSTLVPET